jgi:CBS domain-containing protein
VLRALEYHQLGQESEAEAPITGAIIADMMYRDVPTVLPSASLEETVQALERNRRRRVVVVDNDRRVLGIITDGDLLQRSQKNLHPGLMQRLRSLVTGTPPAAPVSLADSKETAGDLMTAPVITIPVDAAPAEALRLMLKHEIKRLPVVDGEGRLVGLLGRASLLRALVEVTEARTNGAYE